MKSLLGFLNDYALIYFDLQKSGSSFSKSLKNILQDVSDAFEIGDKKYEFEGDDWTVIEYLQTEKGRKDYPSLCRFREAHSPKRA